MNKNTTVLILAGAAIFMYLQHQKKQAVQYQIPANVPVGSPQWIGTAKAIISAAGGLYAELFGPGGPFHNQNPNEVAKLTNSTYIPPAGPSQTGFPTGPIIY